MCNKFHMKWPNGDHGHNELNAYYLDINVRSWLAKIPARCRLIPQNHLQRWCFRDVTIAHVTHQRLLKSQSNIKLPDYTPLHHPSFHLHALYTRGMGLTCRVKKEMAVILKTTISNTFSWNKMVVVSAIKFHWIMFLSVNWILIWAKANNQSLYLNQWWPSLLTIRCVSSPQWVNCGMTGLLWLHVA